MEQRLVLEFYIVIYFKTVVVLGRIGNLSNLYFKTYK